MQTKEYVETPPTRSRKYTKAIESLYLLTTAEKLEAYEQLRELIEQDIKEENAILSQKRSDNDEILESLKK